MSANLAVLLDSKPILEADIVEPVSQERLSKEEFAKLTEIVTEFKQRIEKGEELSIAEAKLITVWFRARRVENFTVAKAAKAAKAKKPKAVGTPVRRRLKSEEKQDLVNAMLANF